MIEQWLARLERHRHAHAINLRQDVIVQVGVHVDVHRAIERVGGFAGVVPRPERGERIRPADGGTEPGGIKTLARGLVEHPVLVLQRERVSRRMRKMAQRTHPSHAQGQRPRGLTDDAGGRPERAAHAMLGLLHPVPCVPGPELVAAVTRERHGHMLARCRRHVVGRHRGGVGERLVEVPRQPGKQRFDMGSHDMRVLYDPEMLRDALRVLQFVVGALREPDRRRDDGCVARLLHEGDDEARIDAAREKRPEWHVADQPHADRLTQLRFERLQPCALGIGSRLGRERQIPVLRHAYLTALRHEHVARRQFVDRPVDRQRRRNIEKGEIGVERLGAPVTWHRRVDQQRLDLRPEHEAVVEQGIVQGLDAYAIAREDQPALPRVPDCEGEHPAQPIHEVDAPLLVPVDEHFGVAGRSEAVSVRLELLAHLGEVVDLAVEDRPYGAVFIRERLVAGGKIDDAQAPMPQPDPFPEIETVRVGPAVPDGICHRAEQIRIDQPSGVPRQFACNAAHGFRRPSVPSTRGRVRVR